MLDMEEKKQATRDRGIDTGMEGLTPSNVVLTNPPPVTFETSSLPSEPGTSQNNILASEIFAQTLLQLEKGGDRGPFPSYGRT